MIEESWGSNAVLAWSDDTNEELKVATMANLNLIKTPSLNDADRGGVSRSFDERVEIDYGGDDFHDPTTNMRQRCALAIAKPTPRDPADARST